MDSDLKDRTKTFAIGIIKFYKSLPKSTEHQVCGKQLLRSGTSVGANTRSAFRGRSKKEFIAKIGIVIEEADECIYWLELLQSLDKYKEKTIENLMREAEELVSIFVSIHKKNV